jgi:hypothetical protein
MVSMAEMNERFDFNKHFIGNKESVEFHAH